MLVVLLVLSLAGSQAPEDEFNPAVDYASKPVEEWIAFLEQGTRSYDSIWSLYYHDVRTPAVIQALRAELDRTDTRSCHTAADIILSDWNVEHPKLPPEAFYGGLSLEKYARQFLPGIPPLEGNAIERIAALEASDESKQLSAAVGMLLHHEDVALVVRTLLARAPSERSLEWGRVLDWSRLFGGSTYFDVLGQMLWEAAQRPTGLDERRAWIDEIAWINRPWGPRPGRAAALPWLQRIVASLPDGSALIQKVIETLLDPDVEGPAYGHEHAHLHLRILQAVGNLSVYLDAHYATEAKRILGASSVTQAELRSLHRAALRYPSVAQQCLSVLPGWLGRADGSSAEALRILGHLGSPDPRVHASYLQTLNQWSDFTEEALHSLPCWKLHDDETRAVFLEVLSKCTDIGGLVEQLAFTGELDSSRSNIGKAVVDRWNGKYPWLVECGLRGIVTPETQGYPARQLNELALVIATKQDLGQDYAAEEQRMADILRPPNHSLHGGPDDFVQWGLFHAQSLGLRSRTMLDAAMHHTGSWRDHDSAVRSYVHHSPFEVEGHRTTRNRAPSGSQGSEWNAAGLGYFSRSQMTRAIQAVPGCLGSLFGGDPYALADVLRFTTLTPRELPFLLTILQRGSVEQRAFTIRLVDEYDLRWPEIDAELARLAASDPDVGVRRQAGLALARLTRPR